MFVSTKWRSDQSRPLDRQRADLLSWQYECSDRNHPVLPGVMRSKGRVITAQNQANMGDKPKSAKKRFRFRGGGNKKENGIIPGGCPSSDPVEDGLCVSVQSATPVGATNHHKVYQLSNSDVINGAVIVSSGSPSHGAEQVSPAGQGDQPVCTCPVPSDETGTPEKDNSPSHLPDAARHGMVSINGCNSQPDVTRAGETDGNHGNKLSVVAVIEGGGLSAVKNEPNVGTSSSNGSSSSTSICSVRPKGLAAVPSTEAILSEIMMTSPQRPLMSRGDRSPSSHSLVSVASSTITIDPQGDSPFGPRLGSERQKQTLGEIIHQIDCRCKSLLSVEDFTNLEPYPDLQFLSHQSRYSSDVHIKRRLIAKLVDSRVVDVFLRVFHSVHTVDYLGDEHSDVPQQRTRSASQASHEHKPDARSLNDGASSTHGAPPPVESAAAEATETTGKTDEKSVGTEGGTSQLDGSKELIGNAVPLTCPALKNLRAAVTLIWNTSDKSPILCEECVKKGVIQLLLDDLRDARLATSELKDQQRLYLVKGYLGILNNIVCFFNDTREIFRDAGAIKILQPYLKSQLLLVKTKTIMLLSYIINESENDVINASDKNIGFMIKMLEATLEKENHYSRKFAFWAVEVAAGK
ncbi:hypothetical protein LSH36_872g00009 [Paralvinella palmiformis]|uniref:Uncharacterized protein n=1 Tax=Paralvinella palmiformis TaxID=53620 RepID=A0AAD9MRV8_9ANNE|nr:hypothetical protein LSH36_872g00009 [Paralvinella palmiformis]